MPISSFPTGLHPAARASRVPELERVLRPYGFLLLDEPRLYDFERYNDCLMKH